MVHLLTIADLSRFFAIDFNSNCANLLSLSLPSPPLCFHFCWPLWDSGILGVAPPLSLVQRSGTAAGICDLRRLKIKRCGGLRAKALLALDFCPGTLRRAAFAISSCPYHLSHFAGELPFLLPPPSSVFALPICLEDSFRCFPACLPLLACFGGQKSGDILDEGRGFAKKSAFFWNFWVGDAKRPKKWQYFGGAAVGGQKQRSFLAGSLLGQ